jgi:hypothetical protein
VDTNVTIKLKAPLQMVVKVDNCHECPFCVNNIGCNLQFLTKSKILTKTCHNKIHKDCPIKDSPMTIHISKNK